MRDSSIKQLNQVAATELGVAADIASGTFDAEAAGVAKPAGEKAWKSVVTPAAGSECIGEPLWPAL